MPTETTYTHARANLAALCDKVASSREPIIIHRRGAEDVALVDAAELWSLTETGHLLRSPKNAQRLITALIRALGGLQCSVIATAWPLEAVRVLCL